MMEGYQKQLIAAIRSGDLEEVKRLVVEGKADVHADGEWALQWAAGNGHLDVVIWLVVEGKADVHADGEWALQLAAGCGHLDVVKWLVEECGAKVTPFMITRVGGDVAIEKYLREHIAKK